jgi:sterol desaturase/sphingolipid hydroxylase (fatty acid hydroxylase superfamily)
MYFPVTILYIYLANLKTECIDSKDALKSVGAGGIRVDNVPGITIDGVILVLKNLLITELAFLFISAYYVFPNEMNYFNILFMMLTQDVYFYTTHRLFHTKYLYKYHKTHHTGLHPLYAWHAEHIDHIIVNLGSIAVPFMIFPNPGYILTLIALLEIYTSVNGHTGKTVHTEHHTDSNKRYGSLYILDRILGTY